MSLVEHSLAKINNRLYCTLSPQEGLEECVEIESPNETSFQAYQAKTL